MNPRVKLARCIEATTLPEQPLSILEQFQLPGKSNKLGAVLRCMPDSLLEIALKNVEQGRAPIANLSTQLVGRGSEGSVFKAGQNHQYAVKFLYDERPVGEVLREHLASYELYCRCFGNMVVKTSFLIGQHRYVPNKSTVVSIQPFVEGLPLFSNIRNADPRQMIELEDRSTTMIDKYGFLPDFGRPDNALVTPDGSIHIVDTGVVTPVAA